MIHPLPQTRWRRRLRSRRGFTVMELMIIVAIIGILSSVVIDAGLREWRREQVNAVVVQLAGWLQSVRRGALKGNSCAVSLAASSIPGLYASGDALAQVSSCGGISDLRLSGLRADQRFSVELLHAADDRVTFTPAGTLSPPPLPEQPIVIRVALQGHPESGRCLQLEGLLGALDVGVPADDDRCAVGAGG